MEDNKIKVVDSENIEKDSRTVKKGRMIIICLTVAALCRLLVAGARLAENINEQPEQPITFNSEYKRIEVPKITEEYNTITRGK